MKISTLFRYIFIIFAIAILIYAAYRIYNNDNSIDEQIIQNEEAGEQILKDIRLAVSNYDTINPLITTNKEVLNIDKLVFEPLFSITQDYNLEPCLATEWSKTGDKIYVVKVDNNIKWHDGSYFTAKDVQFTIDTLKQGNSIYKANVNNISSVEVIDSTTVKLLLDEEIPFFEYNLTFPIMNYMSYFDKDFYADNSIPIGTGRFKISSINSNSITLSKNENWKRAKKNNSKIDTIKINLFQSMGEVFNSFKLGNTDVINTALPNYNEYIGTIGFDITESKGREFDFIALNCNDEILSDKYVRQAISYAIDKDNIISSVYSNQKTTAFYPLDYGNYLYNNEVSSSGYNPEQAKKILEENGWAHNNRWRKEIDGRNKTLTLELSVNSDNQQRVDVAELIKEQLESIGINVKINKLSYNKYQSVLEEKNYQMLLTGIYNSYSPDVSYFFGEGNISNYYNDKVLSIINSGISTKNQNGLKENYKEMLDVYKDEVPFIGLYRSKNITITNKELLGDKITNNYTTFYNFENWYRR